MKGGASNFDWREYLDGLTNYEAARAADYTRERGGLERFRALLDKLRRPQEAAPSVTIAGSKGKGSTAAFLESMLLESGYRPGVYTSPHLLDMRERIRIAGREVTETELAYALREISAASDGCGYVPSWFEAVTAAAFMLFRQNGLSPFLLEVGLGGRLDAVNTAAPAVVVLTRIFLEHTAVLGDSLALIAREKAAVIKPASTVFTVRQHEEVMRVIEARCAEAGATLRVVERPEGSELPPVLAEARALAAAVFEHMTKRAAPRARNLGLPGRYEEVQTGRGRALLDVGHIPEALSALFDYAERRYGEFDLVFGCFADKRIEAMLGAAGERSGLRRVAFAELSHPRALAPEALAEGWSRRRKDEPLIWRLGSPFPFPVGSERPVVVAGGFKVVERFAREVLRR